MSAPDDFRVLAIVSAFNEGDIIGSVLEHLVDNGIDIYLIDNRSTDDTVEQARRWLGKGLLDIEIFPPNFTEVPKFDWGAILRRKEELATELAADWFIHYDADEIREAPWPGVSLVDAIRWVDTLGYNCIDFRVLNFPPIDDGFCQGMDPRSYFRYWETPSYFDEVQMKAWKSGSAPISLAPFGGHEVQFRDRRVFPIRFLLRHYPIRSQAHGERKVFVERKQRFGDHERGKGWHVQYDAFAPGHSFLGEPHELTLFDRDQICLELILDNESARAAVKRLPELESELESERTAFQNRAEAAESEKQGIKRQSAYLEGRTVELERVASRSEAALTEMEQRVKSLEAQRSDLDGQLAASRSSADELSSILQRLQEDHVKAIADLNAIRDSTIWRSTAPLRKFVHAVKQLHRAHIPAPPNPSGSETQKRNISPRSITELLDREGTDKGRWYGGLYDALLQPHRDAINCVIEVGIGTMISDAPSSMVRWGSEHYRPGGSLRAWRDFLPNAEIYGMDVAPDTQFTHEPRIHTYLCDSTDAEQVSEFFARIAPANPDLIVDDGLHEVTAQIKTLRNLFPLLRAGGLYVLEDVAPEDVPTIIAEMPVIHPGCHFFVDSRPEPWVAIVIRKPKSA